MGLRSLIASGALNTGRKIGHALGCELVIETSPHSLETSMEPPNKTNRAWDPDFWKSGQLYVAGYANPVKPVVERHIDQGDQDQVKVQSDDLEDDERHTAIVSSTMYRTYQDQHLASELILPSEQWKRIFYAVVGLGLLMMFSLGVQVMGSGVI